MIGVAVACDGGGAIAPGVLVGILDGSSDFTFGSIGLLTVTMVPSGFRTFINLYPGGGTRPDFGAGRVLGVGAVTGDLSARIAWSLGTTTGGKEVAGSAAVLAMATNQRDQLSRRTNPRNWASQLIRKAPEFFSLVFNNLNHAHSAPRMLNHELFCGRRIPGLACLWGLSCSLVGANLASPKRHGGQRWRTVVSRELVWFCGGVRRTLQTCLSCHRQLTSASCSSTVAWN